MRMVPSAKGAQGYELRNESPPCSQPCFNPQLFTFPPWKQQTIISLSCRPFFPPKKDFFYILKVIMVLKKSRENKNEYNEHFFLFPEPPKLTPHSYLWSVVSHAPHCWFSMHLLERSLPRGPGYKWNHAGLVRKWAKVVGSSQGTFLSI